MSRRAWGTTIALGAAIVSGVAVFVNGYGVQAKAFGNASAYTTAKNLVAAVLLGIVLTAVTARRSAEGFTHPRGRAQWAGLACIGAIGGGIPFILFFEGLARASSTHAAFMQKTLVVWVALLAVPLLKERVGIFHVAAIGLLVGGVVTLDGGLAGFRLGSGEVMIAVATILWSLEVILAKRLLATLSPLTIGTARMGIGLLVLVGWTAISGSWHGLADAGARDWGWALGTGAILTVYVVTWFSALARAQAVDVTAVLVLGAVITALLKTGVQGVEIRPHTLGLALITVGAALVVAIARREPHRVEAST